MSRFFKTRFKKLKKFYQLYTSGLNRTEIEHLLNKDTVTAYSYLKSKTNLELPARRKHTPLSILFVIKELFISFLIQLTPARRMLYGLGLVVFLLGLLKINYSYLIVSFIIMNFLLALELVDKLTTRDELEIAREIQENLQPLEFPKLAMFSFAGFSKPAKVVGGDFFDVVQPNSKLVITIIGDVSGKGVSAALYAAYTQSMFQSFSESGTSPSDILRNLNELISKRLRNGDFITAAVAFFNTEENTVTIARAGHNWPLYYDSGTRTTTALKPRGMSIGIFEKTEFAAVLEEQTIKLKEGDFILLYSDGITEATDPRNTMFDVTGLKTALEESVHESSETIIDHINTRLHEFVKSEELKDDATMLAIKIQKS